MKAAFGLSHGGLLLAAGAALGLAASYTLPTAEESELNGMSRLRRNQGDFARSAMKNSDELKSEWRTGIVTSTRSLDGIRTVRIRLKDENMVGVIPLSHVVLDGVSLAVDEMYAFGKRCRVGVMPVREGMDGVFEIVVREPSNNNNKAPLLEGRENDETEEFLGSLESGAKLDVLGPLPTVTDVISREALGMRKRICVVAGGTGVASFLQLLDLDDGDPTRTFNLVWSTRTQEDDRFCSDALRRACARDPGRYEMHRTLTRRVPRGWRYGSGRVSVDTLRAILPPPSDDVLVVVCGPDGFVQAVAGGERRDEEKGDSGVDRWQGPVGGMLANLGFKGDQVVRL